LFSTSHGFVGQNVAPSPSTAVTQTALTWHDILQSDKALMQGHPNR